MKSIFTFIIPVLISTAAWGQISNSAFDQLLSDKLGADQYGMKMYVFVILKTGENKTQEKSFIDSCFAGHMANMERLSKANQLIVAGPFGKNEADFRGLFILNVKTIKEASLLLETDPAINSKLLLAELYPWYGSAALPEYLEIHNKIWKTRP
jgi:uncharacterized protein YciI